jgi:hypothetical protein
VSLVFCCYLLLLCIFFMEGYYYCYYNTVDCTVCFISCRSCSKEPAYLLFQIFQIFSLHLKFSNLLFEIFKSSLSDHCIIIFRRHTTVALKENSLTPTVDSLKKNHMHFSTTNQMYFLRATINSPALKSHQAHDLKKII